VYPIPEAVDRADVVFLLVPDEVQPEVYRESVEPNLETGDVLNFASGYNVTYGFVDRVGDRTAGRLPAVPPAPRAVPGRGDVPGRTGDDRPVRAPRGVKTVPATRRRSPQL
jgi:ketol-acid reductoisomerase